MSLRLHLPNFLKPCTWFSVKSAPPEATPAEPFRLPGQFPHENYVAGSLIEKFVDSAFPFQVMAHSRKPLGDQSVAYIESAERIFEHARATDGSAHDLSDDPGLIWEQNDRGATVTRFSENAGSKELYQVNQADNTTTHLRRNSNHTFEILSYTGDLNKDQSKTFQMHYAIVDPERPWNSWQQDLQSAP